MKNIPTKDETAPTINSSSAMSLTEFNPDANRSAGHGNSTSKGLIKEKDFREALSELDLHKVKEILRIDINAAKDLNGLPILPQFLKKEIEDVVLKLNPDLIETNTIEKKNEY